MYPARIHHFCNKNMGRKVVIIEKCGRRHMGTLTRVDRDMVWIMPEGNFCRYGMGYWGFGRSRFGIGIAIGAIAGIVLAAAFFS